MIEVIYNLNFVFTLGLMLVIAVVTHITKSIIFKVILFVLSIFTTVHFINTAPNVSLISYIALSSVVNDPIDNVQSYYYYHFDDPIFFMSEELMIIIVFTYMTYMLYKVYSTIRHMLA